MNLVGRKVPRLSVVLVFAITSTLVAQDQIDGKARVYVSDSQSWQVSGGFAAHGDSGGNFNAAGHFAGGSRPQTVEVIKTFTERCPGVVVTMDRAKADYVVLFDREGGKGYARKRDKIAVFKNNGDLVYSGSTRSLGNAVQDACGALQKQ